MQTFRSLLIGALIATAMPVVQAAVTEVATDEQAKQELAKYMRPDTVISEHGNRPAKLSPVKSGNDVPLKDAIRQLAPVGWKGFASGADLTRQVSWEASASWLAALETVLTKNGYAATIDWTGKRILLVGTAKKETSTSAVNKDSSTSAAVAQSPWTAEPGDRASEILARWASKAGWQASWEAEDLAVGGSIRLGGDFSAAVVLLVDALNRSTSGALKPRFYELDANRTVRVTDKGTK